MKLKASYFSVSKPLIIEDLRRFWAIPALAFLVYFQSGVFPVLMSYGHLNDMGNYITMSLNNQQPFYMFAHLLFPVIAAVVIFRYLQGISSVSVMHSMPFTRAKLYNSGFLAGLILIAAPILANGLILLAISKPVYNQYASTTGIVTDTVNLFARTDILNWIWVSLIIAFTIYAVSVFAGIVTGNSLMHFATAVWFNFLIPALYAVFIAYFSHYLFGFDTSGYWTEYGMRISPYLNVLQNEGHFGAGATVYYIVSILILYGVTSLLYQKRKLERATDSLAFTFMEPIICYLIAFLGMTLLGFYFQALGQSELYMYAGLAAGTVIFFIIGQMIVKKTPRIYNGKSLKNFGIYALIAVVFILSLNFDLTGFEKRVPDPGKVESAAFSEGFNLGGMVSMNYVNGKPIHTGFGDGNGFRFKDPTNIKALTGLHQSLINNKTKLENLENLFTSSIYLEYNTDSVFPLTRRYQIDYDYYRHSPEFKQLYESKEFKDFFAPGNLNYIGLSGIFISSDQPIQATVDIRNKADMLEFLACMDADFKAQSFEDMSSLKHPYAVADVSFTYKDKNSKTPDQILNNNANFKISSGYKNTIKWLEAHGYGSRFIRSADKIEYIELYHYVQQENIPNQAQPAQFGPNQVTSAVSSDGLKIDDPMKIQQLLDTYESQNVNYDDYYYGTIVYKGSGEPIDPAQLYKDNYGYNPDLAEKYGTAADSGITMQIYFNEGNIPDYVLEYFKNK
jgi:ABC-2 type transport system permease protein